MPIPAYPGAPIRKGSDDVASVQRIQAALAALGLAEGFTPGVFDVRMDAAVHLFQSRQVDTASVPLKVDGIVGRFTWIALFGLVEQGPNTGTTELAVLSAQWLTVAITQIGVMELPGKPNRGPQVDQYLHATGITNPGAIPGGYPWCQAFLYWGMVQACTALGRSNVPIPRTAGVLEHWRLCARVPKVVRISKAQALENPSLVTPGMVFALDFGSGHGHTGLVERIHPDGRLVTIEGNSNGTGGREGVGVFRLERRKLTEDNLRGFVDYGAA